MDLRDGLDEGPFAAPYVEDLAMPLEWVGSERLFCNQRLRRGHQARIGPDVPAFRSSLGIGPEAGQGAPSPWAAEEIRRLGQIGDQHPMMSNHRGDARIGEIFSPRPAQPDPVVGTTLDKAKAFRCDNKTESRIVLKLEPGGKLRQGEGTFGQRLHQLQFDGSGKHLRGHKADRKIKEAPGPNAGDRPGQGKARCQFLEARVHQDPVAQISKSVEKRGHVQRCVHNH